MAGSAAVQLCWKSWESPLSLERSRRKRLLQRRGLSLLDLAGGLQYALREAAVLQSQRGRGARCVGVDHWGSLCVVVGVVVDGRIQP